MIQTCKRHSTVGCNTSCKPIRDVDPLAKDAPRVQLNLPNVYWTLVTPFATIVGVYTNVPEGGSIDSTQQQWVTNEFATAPTYRALILALHHPIYSFDVFHSRSSKMADVLENAIRDTGRVPNLVLSGHVPIISSLNKPSRRAGRHPSSSRVTVDTIISTQFIPRQVTRLPIPVRF
jgi:hypothetical protein